MHDIMAMLSNRYPATGGGVEMEMLITFCVTVVGGVACHYIIKWLDRNDKGNKYHTPRLLSTIIEKTVGLFHERF